MIDTCGNDMLGSYKAHMPTPALFLHSFLPTPDSFELQQEKQI